MPPRMAVLRPQSSSGDARRFDALGSDVRNRVLEILSKGEATVLQIAAGAHANPATLRSHLGPLPRAPLLDPTPASSCAGGSSRKPAPTAGARGVAPRFSTGLRAGRWSPA